MLFQDSVYYMLLWKLLSDYPWGMIEYTLCIWPGVLSVGLEVN